MSGILIINLVTVSQGLAGVPVAMSVSTDGELSHGVKANLELTSSHRGPVFTPDGRAGLHEERRHTFSAHGEVGYGELIDLKMRSDFVDCWQFGEGEYGEFAFATAGDAWQENKVGETEITLSAFNNRLRFTSRRAWSRYSASTSYLENLTGNEDHQRGRFMGHQDVSGTALRYRSEADLWNGRQGNLSIFAQYSKVDLFFESLKLAKELEERGGNVDADPFITPNEESVRFGTMVGLGPIDVTLYRDSVREIEGAHWDEALRNAASVRIDLEDLRNGGGEAFQTSLSAFTPDSVWTGLAKSEIDFSGDARGFVDATSDVSFGASWSWRSGYADVGFWRSFYDGRGVGTHDYYWAGHGADVSFGFYGRNWNVDTSFGLNRSENLETVDQSIDKVLEGRLRVTLRPKTLPNLSGGLSVGRYGTDYFAYEGGYLAYAEASRTDTWELDAALDFSKSLPGRNSRARPRLKVLYGFGSATPAHHAFTSTGGDTDHTFGFLFQLKL